MDAALQDMTAVSAGASPARIDAGRVRDILLIRLATEEKPATREALARELAPLAGGLVSPADWVTLVARGLAALADAGLVETRAVGVEVTDAGRKRAPLVLGGRAALPKSWRVAREQHLVAKALGIENESPRRLRLLSRPDGLRALIVTKAFNIKIRGVPTPSRVRVALARVALERAFGKKSAGEAGRKTGLSPKAGRMLAGQLSSKPQDYRTDARLLAALAAEHVGATKGDVAALQLALLRKYVAPGMEAARADPAGSSPRRTARRTAKARPANRRAPPQAAAGKPAAAAHPQPAPTPAPAVPRAGSAASGRPDVNGFAAEVRRQAETVAEGWSGNRKAYVSRVWRALAAAKPEWSISEIEFKCMLAEAHRLGAIVLANADLKDQRNIKDVQESALSYRNAVFHFVRVDD